MGAATQHAPELAYDDHGGAAERDRCEPDRGALRARPTETVPGPGAAPQPGWPAQGAHPGEPSAASAPDLLDYFSSVMIVLTEATGAIGELDLDHEGADLAERLLEADLAPVDAQVASLTNRVDDLLGADRAEQLAVLARALVDRQHSFGEQAGGLGFALGAGSLGLLGGGAAALRFLQGAGGRRLGELATGTR